MRRWLGGRGVARVVALAIVVMLAATARPSATRAQAEPEAPASSGVPVRLVLPAIGVDAEVGAFALNADLTMPVPQVAWQVAWYTFSAVAGGGGNAVLAGHRDWQRQRGVFYDLGRVQEGDEVWLQDAVGNFYLYSVVWSLSMADDTAPVEDIAGPTAVPSVTLITCSGTFDRGIGRYVERRIVRAQLVTVLPTVSEEAARGEPADAEAAGR